MTREVRCPMRECRKRIDLDALPPFPEQPVPLPCLHYIAGWGGATRMVEAVLYGLDGNRELAIRNIRPPDVRPEYLDESRDELEAAARRFAHEVDGMALFGDVHEQNAVARLFAQIIIGPDPMSDRRTAGGGRR